jgi:hypothetical protein
MGATTVKHSGLLVMQIVRTRMALDRSRSSHKGPLTAQPRHSITVGRRSDLDAEAVICPCSIG